MPKYFCHVKSFTLWSHVCRCFVLLFVYHRIICRIIFHCIVFLCHFSDFPTWFSPLCAYPTLGFLEGAWGTSFRDVYDGQYLDLRSGHDYTWLPAPLPTQCSKLKNIQKNLGENNENFGPNFFHLIHFLMGTSQTRNPVCIYRAVGTGFQPLV